MTASSSTSARMWGCCRSASGKLRRAQRGSLSVEAHPKNWPALEARRARSLDEVPARGGQIPAGWDIEKSAISVAAGQLELQGFREANGTWNCSARHIYAPDAQTVGPSVDEHGRVRVACHALGDLVPTAEIIKIDVEGHEYTILDNDLERMASARAWLIEFHMLPDRPLEQELRRFKELGYRVFAASARRDDPSGAWHSMEIDARVTWAQIPVAKQRADGSVFKMLHVMARR